MVLPCDRKVNVFSNMCYGIWSFSKQIQMSRQFWIKMQAYTLEENGKAFLMF